MSAVDILAFAREFEQRVQIVGQAADAVVCIAESPLQPLAVLHDLLAFFGLRFQKSGAAICFFEFGELDLFLSRERQR